MINLTLKHFRYFDALARHGHFGRAAEACSISQPALSVQIKELEAMLGAPLVERSARKIRLTTLGEEFLERAQKVLADVEAMGDLARLSEGPLKGRLRMGIIPTVAPYLLPAIIRGLSEELPDLELRPREAVTQSLLDDLRHSRLDFIVAALPVSEPAFREFALFDEEFVLVRAGQDAHKPVPSPSKLQEMKLLLLEEGHCFRDQALEFCEIKQSDPSLLMEGSSLSTLVQMVDAGLGLTLIPEMAITLEQRGTSVSLSRFESAPPKRTIGMVWRRTNPLQKQLLDLGSMLRRIGQERQDRL
ncbi:hydrogen peroxide-inducible genes activator [Cognatishimia maritima]|uniref:LysR family transcriptional regulator, hydrogen peroxide-inducible genes activator n=1 Tax=Cognatishimia maritima TaxID=870908 RepID=A0A1M5KQG2_9RHOB|nr:hydrogen peroxide-inducible genes activator [Cognatishimia maritima]SHG55027.1 LysR family transcriptional regulator, hydrogen peroxide-inducible genes activator [Cognatishimia maritima]